MELGQEEATDLVECVRIGKNVIGRVDGTYLGMTAHGRVDGGGDFSLRTAERLLAEYVMQLPDMQNRRRVQWTAGSEELRYVGALVGLSLLEQGVSYNETPTEPGCVLLHGLETAEAVADLLPTNAADALARTQQFNEAA